MELQEGRQCEQWRYVKLLFCKFISSPVNYEKKNLILSYKSTQDFEVNIHKQFVLWASLAHLNLLILQSVCPAESVKLKYANRS